MVRSSMPSDLRAILTARAVFETEAFLIEAMRHPERWRRIPVLRVGYGVFSPRLAQEYWNTVLELEES